MPSHRYTTAGMYAVKLYAYNTANCVDSFELQPIHIIADTVVALTVPNAFSPNQDGMNDTWIIKALQGNTNCKVTIYNRWGQAIFTSIGYSKPWDGTYSGKPLPIDTYYYTISANAKTYSGSVTLLR
ncbi:MAG: gliding motility-associated C-terminal domain-containing protein [Hymenobacter sp.]|nr:MAG: gliding motility-associated C-terminal domain-containing protein [Hymenobacter sp.]